MNLDVTDIALEHDDLEFEGALDEFAGDLSLPLREAEHAAAFAKHDSLTCLRYMINKGGWDLACARHAVICAWSEINTAVDYDKPKLAAIAAMAVEEAKYTLALWKSILEEASS